jgi:hypothetical protein
VSRGFAAERHVTGLLRWESEGQCTEIAHNFLSDSVTLDASMIHAGGRLHLVSLVTQDYNRLTIFAAPTPPRGLERIEISISQSDGPFRETLVLAVKELSIAVAATAVPLDSTLDVTIDVPALA